MKYILIAVFIFSGVFGYSQKTQSKAFDDMAFYSDVMINAAEEEHRNRALQVFLPELERFMAQDSSFYIGLDTLKSISVLQNDEFRMISFPFEHANGSTDNYSYIQHHSGKFYKLESTADHSDIEYEVLHGSKGLSGLYYHMAPYESNGKQNYLLFSYGQPDRFTKRKVIDILHWEGDKPVFGEASFVFKKEGARDILRNRLVYYYSSDMVMGMSYEKEVKTIVLDHLMEVKGRMAGQTNTMVPDGTYEAFVFETGKWIFKDKLYEDEAPLIPPQRKKESAERDIFGQIKNK